MGIFDEMKDKAESLIGKNKDKAHQGLEKGADLADEKTGGKYSDHIDKGEAKAHDIVDRMPGE